MISDVLYYLGTALGGVLFLFLLWFVKFETSRKRKLLNKLPSPQPNYYLLGNATIFMGPSEDAFLKGIAEMKRLHYSPIICLWIGTFPRVSCLKSAAVEMLLSSTKWLDKASQYRFLHPWLGLGLLTSTGKKWHTRRKLITPSFHFRILEDFLPIIFEQADLLVSLIKEKQKDAFNIYPYLMRCTLDIICETAMGCSVKAQGHEDSEYVKAVNFMAHIMTDRSLNPFYANDLLFSLSGKGRKEQQCLKMLHGFTYKVIKERRAEFSKIKNGGGTKPNEDTVMGVKKRVAFLDMLLSSTVDGKSLTDEDIREEVDTFMFEGHDTTSSGLGWILYNVGRFPLMQEKIVDELRSIGLMDDLSRKPTTEEIKQLKYLECFIKESMRLFPPVPFFGRIIPEDTEICGYKIPAGTSVTVNAFMVHRDPDQFPDPEKFDPDRFLPEVSVNRHPYAYVPFSAGPRNCIGQKFALLEEKIVVLQLLRHFQLNSIYRLEEVKIAAELILRPADGIWIKFEGR